MYKRHIHAVCNCSAHLFPVRMRYGGRRWWSDYRWGTHLAYVMYCPVSHVERIYIYVRGRLRRAA